MEIQFELINSSSPYYKESLKLRNCILRKPLGLVFSEKDYLSDSQDEHLILLIEDKVEAVLLLKRIDKSSIKMRQVAVSEKFQGKGLGSKLVHQAELVAKENGFLRMELNARKGAIKFYLQQNYFIEGEEFYEVGIPHKKMYKDLC